LEGGVYLEIGKTVCCRFVDFSTFALLEGGWGLVRGLRTLFPNNPGSASLGVGGNESSNQNNFIQL
jgi:hypothetical protein